ncbi:MAG: hypothetical protein EBY20_02065 [Alphaproteobacteria bacterium]|nr:hypothetical protein [Alphaproteobacteria bacterium]
MLAVKLDSFNSSTGDKEEAKIIGYDASKYNALKHGVLSKYTVMHWENRSDYDSLFISLINEHKPVGATEEHLVEELVGVIWRKMRLRYAEMASLQSSLSKDIGVEFFSNKDSVKEALLRSSDDIRSFDVKQAVLSTEEETKKELTKINDKLKCCLLSEQIIAESESYNDALIALDEEDQNDWIDNCLGEHDDNQSEKDVEQFADEYYTASTEDLLLYIEDLKKRYENRIYELENRSKVKHQTLGKAFFYDKELSKYMRYESHLDKKFEKTLAMLIRLQDLRKGYSVAQNNN